jgi:hypothetical protein
MLETELFAATSVLERENYFASAQFKARTDWRSGLLAKVRRQRKPTTQRQRAEAQRERMVTF